MGTCRDTGLSNRIDCRGETYSSRGDALGHHRIVSWQHPRVESAPVLLGHTFVRFN